jgi:hypothetical protein
MFSLFPWAKRKEALLMKEDILTSNLTLPVGALP